MVLSKSPETDVQTNKSGAHITPEKQRNNCG